MPVEPIRKAGPDDAASMSAALAAAFYADPFFRWMLPDDDHRAAALPEFFALVVDVLAVHDAWTRLAGVHADRMLGLFELADQHHPAEPHEYLFFVGVQPDSQGRGVGQALTLPCWSGRTPRATPAIWRRRARAAEGCTSGSGSRPSTRSRLRMDRRSGRWCGIRSARDRHSPGAELDAGPV